MISKLRFSLIAVVMLVLLGFGFQDQARGQVGAGGLFCPAVPNTTGYLEAEIVGSGAVAPNFTGALIGTVESLGIGVNFGDNVAGLDWQHVDLTSFYSPTPTNEVGSQLVSWWTQKNGRNTYLQVTNNDPFGKINVHVRIHNEDCAEIRDFCDTFTPNDTHEYNLGDLFANNGADISEANLQGVEGWLVVTAVDDCGLDSEVAYNFNHLSGQLIVSDSDDYVYGVNTYARRAVCFPESPSADGNRIANGSFGTGDLMYWDSSTASSNGAPTIPNRVTEAGSWSPVNVPTPENFEDSPFQGTVINGTNGNYNSSDFSRCKTSDCQFTGAVVDKSYGVLSQKFFRDSIDGNTISGNIQFMNEDIKGDAAIAVVLYDHETDPPTLLDSQCWMNTAQTPAIKFGGLGCAELITNATLVNLFDVDFNELSPVTPWSLDISTNTGELEIQVVAVSSMDRAPNGGSNVAATFNDVFVQQNAPDLCDGSLDGRNNARLDNVLPETLYAQFNILPSNDFAGADVVHINFADQYGPPYRVIKATSNVEIGIYDEDENFQSCGDATGVCFVRLGIDDPIVLSEDFDPFIPTLPPTSTPPTSTPPTDTPTTRPPSGGSSSCAIAGSPVQLGTALANVLIPLVPVAFAFGVRAVRRRKK